MIGPVIGNWTLETFTMRAMVVCRPGIASTYRRSLMAIRGTPASFAVVVEPRPRVETPRPCAAGSRVRCITARLHGFGHRSGRQERKAQQPGSWTAMTWSTPMCVSTSTWGLNACCANSSGAFLIAAAITIRSRSRCGAATTPTSWPIKRRGLSNTIGLSTAKPQQATQAP